MEGANQCCLQQVEVPINQAKVAHMGVHHGILPVQIGYQGRRDASTTETNGSDRSNSRFSGRLQGR